MSTTKKRNWSQYNQRLKRQARLELYISKDMFKPFDGVRKSGGVVLYRDALIEACLLMREYFSLALRQTQGFMESIAAQLSKDCAVPDYTTLCRRNRTCRVDIVPRVRQLRQGHILAIDSTGLSLMTGDSWNRYKHHDKKGRDKKGNNAWHKMHIAIDTKTGDILACVDTPATTNDCCILPKLLNALPSNDVAAVCADMAYDTLNCYKAITGMGARPRIPPKRTAIPTAELKKPLAPSDVHALRARDEAIYYVRANRINGDESLARKRWKALTGYHRRSLAETTMSRIKIHTGSTLQSRRDDCKTTECRIKCKLLNLLNAA
jgi:Transposase DDE domain